MNHAVFCVTPSERPSSHELTPFFAFTITHKAGIHFDKDKGESSKIVPTFALNWFLHSRHFQRRALAKKSTSPLSHRLHRTTPSGQRSNFINSNALSASAK